MRRCRSCTSRSRARERPRSCRPARLPAPGRRSRGRAPGCRFDSASDELQRRGDHRHARVSSGLLFEPRQQTNGRSSSSGRRRIFVGAVQLDDRVRGFRAHSAESPAGVSRACWSTRTLPWGPVSGGHVAAVATPGGLTSTPRPASAALRQLLAVPGQRARGVDADDADHTARHVRTRRRTGRLGVCSSTSMRSASAGQPIAWIFDAVLVRPEVRRRRVRPALDRVEQRVAARELAVLGGRGPVLDPQRRCRRPAPPARRRCRRPRGCRGRVMVVSVASQTTAGFSSRPLLGEPLGVQHRAEREQHGVDLDAVAVESARRCSTRPASPWSAAIPTPSRNSTPRSRCMRAQRSPSWGPNGSSGCGGDVDQRHLDAERAGAGGHLAADEARRRRSAGAAPDRALAAQRDRVLEVAQRVHPVELVAGAAPGAGAATGGDDQPVIARPRCRPPAPRAGGAVEIRSRRSRGASRRRARRAGTPSPRSPACRCSNSLESGGRV